MKRSYFLFSISLFVGASSAFAQANDFFSGRTVITGTSATTMAVLSDNASIEPGEPAAHYMKSLWYTWTAPADLRVTLSTTGSTGSGVRMFVYTGTTLATLCPVLSTDQSSLTWLAPKGVTYQIAVDRSYYTSSYNGYVVLTLASSPWGSGVSIVAQDTPTSAAPTNDNFATPKAIPALPATLIVYTGGATREPGEPTGDGENTVWYSYTATEDQWVNVTLDSSTETTFIRAYQGESYATLQALPSDGDHFSVLMKKGTAYHFSVGNYLLKPAGNMAQLSFSATRFNSSGTVYGPDLPTANTPANDNFADRKVLLGSKVTAFAYNTQATRESFEPGTWNRTLWYSWGTDQAGTVTVTVGRVGSDYQELGVYTGLDIAALKPVTVSQSGSVYTFTAEPNVTYQLMLATYASNNGLVILDLAGPGAGSNALDAVPKSAGAGSKMINLSTRSIVPAGGAVIPGFVVAGSTRKTILVRGIGPALAGFGVANALPDPVITLYSGSNVIATNDNWSSSAANVAPLRAAFSATGAFPLADGSKDAALLISVDPGAYTVMLKDAKGGGGDGMIEVYEVY